VSGLQTWVNAVSNGTAAPSGGGLGNDIGKSLCIGQEVDAAINGVAGSTYVDFALWNVTLTQNEIMLLSFGVRPLFIRPEALIGYWPITGLGLYETDKSSYGNNGTVIGGALAPDPPFLARNIILGSPDEGEMSMLPGPPALRQKHFRFRTDTAAADATPTWGALEDAN
jgi:hypothetical protein